MPKIPLSSVHRNSNDCILGHYTCTYKDVPGECISVLVSTPIKFTTLQEEKPHVHQVERFAQGEFDYHDEDLHTPIIW